jgi:hypothetical protein
MTEGICLAHSLLLFSANLSTLVQNEAYERWHFESRKETAVDQNKKWRTTNRVMQIAELFSSELL